MQAILDQCRQRAGATPRKFSLWERHFYLPIRSPEWIDEDEGISQIIKYQEKILRGGQIVWAHLIQANSLLFQEGKENCPGEVLYCPDEKSKIEIANLQLVARKIGLLKGTSPDDEDLYDIAGYLTDEMTRVFGLQVPQSIAWPHELLISTVLFERRHLPNGKLSRPAFPIVIGPHGGRAAIVLPSRYWPDTLVRWWLAAS